MSSLFSSDLKESDIINDYLDLFFYNKLQKDGVIEGFKRISELDDQLKGIDVIVHNNGSSYLIDEKAQSHYISSPLPTFAFEVSYLKNGDKRQGWLVSEKKNDYWLIIWPHKNENRCDNFDMKSIKFLELMLIKVESLLRYFEQNGWTKDEIISFDYYIRAKGHDNKRGKVDHHFVENFGRKIDERKFYWFTSSQLDEKPVNIVVRKRELEKIALSRYIVSKYNYWKTK